MPNRYQLGAARTTEGRRWIVGVAVASRCHRTAASLVDLQGRGLDAVADVIDTRSDAIGRETISLFNTLSHGSPCLATTLAALRSQLAQSESSLVLDLLSEHGVAADDVLAVGVIDPGLWEYARNEPTAYLGLCDSARLAERTGINVIDAFPARDVVCGGQGGPLSALPAWILMRDRLRNRVLLDLSSTVHLTFLPAMRGESPETGIIAFEVGPGTSLLDSLTQRLTGGQQSFDPGGRLAVQGKRLPALIEHWMSDPYFECPPPRWHPRGVRPERFLADAVQMAVASDWTVRDLLCTATHFVAEMVARTLHRLIDSSLIDEIVVTGGGQHNGLLLHEIGRWTGKPLLHMEDLNIADGAFAPATAALLAMLAIDQVPANPSVITKTTTPRLLGALTAGSPASWRRLLESSTNGSSSLRPLRAAI